MECEVVFLHLGNTADARTLRVLCKVAQRLVEQAPVAVRRLRSELVSAASQDSYDVASGWPGDSYSGHAISLEAGLLDLYAVEEAWTEVVHVSGCNRVLRFVQRCPERL